MIRIEFTRKVSAELEEPMVVHIAHEFLEYLDSIGYRLKWNFPEKIEPVDEKGEPLSYEELAERFVERTLKYQG